MPAVRHPVPALWLAEGLHLGSQAEETGAAANERRANEGCCRWYLQITQSPQVKDTGNQTCHM